MNPNKPFVITISREIGSGGHTVGRILAEKMNTRYCDKDLVKALEKKFNLTAEKIEKIKLEKRHWLADFLSFVNPAPTAHSLGVNTDNLRDITTGDIFKAETEILKALAEEGSCIIAGRSGFHVLKNHPNHLRVFITASKPRRIQRVMKKQALSEHEATRLVEEIDKAREGYIKRYSGADRYDARNYDLTLNMDFLTEEKAAELILAYFQNTSDTTLSTADGAPTV